MNNTFICPVNNGHYFHLHLRMTMRCWPWQSVPNLFSGFMPFRVQHSGVILVILVILLVLPNFLRKLMKNRNSEWVLVLIQQNPSMARDFIWMRTPA